ncbi:MAG: hypothetical protein GY755_02410 [Chloroflexi bacterium]|nr:hypothetical protein [Chloroflexota bacterium]
MISGRYDYFLNEEQIALYETFQITRDEGLATLISAERVAEAFGNHLRVDTRQKDGAFDQVEIAYASSGKEGIREANLRVNIHDNIAEVVRVVDGLSIQEKITLPKEYAFLPLLRVFTGNLILKLSEKHLPVCIPNIKNPQDKENWFALNIEQRWATKDGDAFQFLGGQYDEKARFWLNDDGFLKRYIWNQKENLRWDVRLTEFVNE